MEFSNKLKYTKDHEWLKIEGDFGIVGITEYAQGELGDVVFVELPQIGMQVKLGERFGTIEAVKAVSDCYAPVTGEVVEINTNLEKTPELLNKEPYVGGWMVKFKIKDKNEINTLLDSEKYKQLVGK